MILCWVAPPSPSNKSQMKVSVGIPDPTNVIILVVTGILGGGDNPNFKSIEIDDCINWLNYLYKSLWTTNFFWLLLFGTCSVDQAGKGFSFF